MHSIQEYFNDAGIALGAESVLPYCFCENRLKFMRFVANWAAALFPKHYSAVLKKRSQKY